MKYEYTQFNQFNSPCRYTYSSYGGHAFLDNYEKNRTNLLKSLSTEQILFKDIDEILSFILSSLDSYFLGHSIQYAEITESNAHITDKILQNFSEILVSQKFLLDRDLKTINNLVKRFEISKKLYSRYNSEYKLPQGSFNEPERYCIFSLILLACYINTSNFQYFSTASG